MKSFKKFRTFFTPHENFPILTTFDNFRLRFHEFLLYFLTVRAKLFSGGIRVRTCFREKLSKNKVWFLHIAVVFGRLFSRLFFQKPLFINYSVGELGFELIFAKNSLNDRGMILTYCHGCHGILTTFYRTILSKNTFSSTIQWGIRVQTYFHENVVQLNEVSMILTICHGILASFWPTS